MPKPKLKRILLLLAILAVLIIFCVIRATSIPDPIKNIPGSSGTPTIYSPEIRQYIQDQQAEASGLLVNSNLTAANLVLTQLIEKYPNDAQSHVLLCQVLDQQKNYSQAYDHAREALALDNSLLPVHQFAGQLAIKLDKLDNAIQHFTDAANLNPAAPQYPLRLAAIHLKLNQPDKAQIQALRALSLDASLDQLYSMLAEIAGQKGKLKMAVDQINKALVLSENKPQRKITYIIQKARLLRRDNQPQRALDTLAEISELAKIDQLVAKEFSDSYLMLSQPAKAAKIWADLHTHRPQLAQAAVQAAVYYHRAGDKQNADYYFKIAKKLKPYDPQVQELEPPEVTPAPGS